MKKKRLIYVVDDEEIIRQTLADDLLDAGFRVEAFANARACMAAAAESRPDAVVTDVRMPGIDGMALLKRVKELHPETSVILMTAFGTVGAAVEAMKAGAFDYVTKPFDFDELLILLSRAFELQGSRREIRSLRKRLAEEHSLESYMGSSNRASETRRLLGDVAVTEATVLLVGETGTGKELAAGIIHHASSRASRRFIRVSCAVLSREVFESELFGHVKGAFTGAERSRRGRFLAAHGGSILLDDIDDIPLDLQVKLLRVLQEREVEPVGASEPVPVDVRIIAATKKDLAELVREGSFREDLYYRLNVLPVDLPPLRERPEDIPELVYHFARKMGCRQDAFAEEALELLRGHDWPGNVRELRNVVERMVLLSGGGCIDAERVPKDILRRPADPGTNGGSLEMRVAAFERSLIEQALDSAGGNRAGAARALQIPPSTLRSKLGKLEL
jgi:two-component system, NtrC family, response regulator